MTFWDLFEASSSLEENIKSKFFIINIALTVTLWVSDHLHLQGPEVVVSCKHNFVIWVVGKNSPIYRHYILID